METICDNGLRDVYLRACPCRDILDLVASKWTSLIIGSLEEGPHRFGQLMRAVDGITQKVLTQTLRKLERDGLVRRRVVPARPPQVEYSLTPLGLTVTAPLAALRTWSEEHFDGIEAARLAFDEEQRIDHASEPVG